MKPPFSIFNVPLLIRCLRGLGNLALVSSIHCKLLKSGTMGTSISNHLINAYLRCQTRGSAHMVFDELPEPNVVSWTSLMAGYVDAGQPDIALLLIGAMSRGEVQPNSFTFTTAIDACARLAKLCFGQEIHARVETCGIRSDIVVSTALINMYSKCNEVNDARKIFDDMVERNVISWGSMISAYAQNADGDDALTLFSRFRQEGWSSPNHFMFSSVVNACASVGRLTLGSSTHASIIKHGYESNENELLVQEAFELQQAAVDKKEEEQEHKSMLQVFMSMNQEQNVAQDACISVEQDAPSQENAAHALQTMEPCKPRWKGKDFATVALANPMTSLVSQLQTSLIDSKATALLSTDCDAILEVKPEIIDLLNRASFGRLIITSEKEKQWLQLGPYECFYMFHSLNCIKIVSHDRAHMNSTKLWNHFSSIVEAFPELYTAYSHLRSKNWVVKSGMQYGMDFVAYRHHPALVHAEYAVLVIPEGSGHLRSGRLRTWPDLHGTLRLCVSVAKTLLVLHISNNSGVDRSTLGWLDGVTVEERIINRWIPERSRED